MLNLLEAGKTGTIAKSAIDGMTGALQRVEQLATFRNEMMHTTWTLSLLPSNSLAEIVGIAKGVFARSRDLTDVAIAAVEMRELAMEIQALREAIGNRIDPGPSALIKRWTKRRSTARIRRTGMKKGDEGTD